VLLRKRQPVRLADVSQHPAAAGFPAGHPVMTGFLGVPISVRGEVFGLLYLADKRTGEPFDDRDESVVVTLAAAAAVAIENARLFEAARSRQGWLNASIEVSSSLLSGDEPEEVLGLVARRARELSGAEGAFIALPVSDTHLLVEVTAGDAQHLAGIAIGIQTSACGRVLATGEPATTTGGQTIEELQGQHSGSLSIVPLGPPGSTEGVLGVIGSATDARLSTADMAELNSFARQATIALQVAQRRRDAERLTVLEDRDRIARDLHDMVIQRLFATGMQLESATRLVERPAAAERIRSAVHNLDGTIREIRSTIYGLQTTLTDPRPSLRARLLEVVDGGSEQLGFMPSMRLSGLVDTAVPAHTGEHLLAVVREALSNVARHAGATRVTVTLNVDDDVRLTVQDNGCGLPSDLERRSGLANLQSRAAELGGSAKFSSTPEGGTLVVWTVPL
jgi:signal transduction histidine kinase